MKRLAASRLAACVLLLAGPAYAAGPLGPDGSPVRTSNYAVDLTITPVLAGSRVTGLAGAYVAIAEGVDGSAQTPAAPGVRAPYSVDHFDYDFGLGLSLPATVTGTDFFNTGRGNTSLGDAEQEAFVFVTPALLLQWGGFGLGLYAEGQTYGVLGARGEDGTRDRLSAEFGVVRVQVARALFDHQLVVGAGLRVSTLSLTNPRAGQSERQLFSTTGTGLEFGAVYAPIDLPFRLGAAVRTAVTTAADPASSVPTRDDGDRIVGDPADPAGAFWLPERVTTPWDLNVGLAVQIGPRPLNPRWLDPRKRALAESRANAQRARERRRAHQERLSRSGRRDPADAQLRAARAEVEHEDALDELRLERVKEETRESLKRRYASFSRSYALVSMSLLVVGPAEEAVGIESFLSQRVARSGEVATFSPRLGVESEVVPHWLKARVGTYGEPSRFAGGSARLHGTLGFDAKLFPWTVFGVFDEGTEWRLGASLDAARRYFGWGVSVGVWH